MIECLADLTIRCGGQVHALQPGHTIDLPVDKAERLLKRAPGRVRLLDKPTQPIAPIKPGWLVVYRDRIGKLCGGFDDREHGTVRECRWNGAGWTVDLTDGQRMPLSMIRAIGQTDNKGRICAAWTVREHGFDGKGAILK
jgi:hypothetical protein